MMFETDLSVKEKPASVLKSDAIAPALASGDAIEQSML